MRGTKTRRKDSRRRSDHAERRPTEAAGDGRVAKRSIEIRGCRMRPSPRARTAVAAAFFWYTHESPVHATVI